MRNMTSIGVEYGGGGGSGARTPQEFLQGGLAPVEVLNRNGKQFKKWKLKKRLVTIWTFHK